MNLQRIFVPGVLSLLMAGCATTECFKGDGLYEANNSDCFRFCADPGCKYWGYTRDDAEESLIEARVAAEVQAVKHCKSLGLSEGTKDFSACTRTWLQDRNLRETRDLGNQRMTPNTYYLEK